MIRRTLVVLALVLAACSRGEADDRDHPVGRTLIDPKPRGYELVEAPATGPMDLDEAATSTEASQTRLRRQLGTTGFQEGYARVWREGEEFIAVLAYDFLSSKRASELVEFMADQLADKRSAAAFKVPDVPRAKGSILNARNDEGTNLFCQLVWFSVSQRTYGIRVCGTSPNSAEQATTLAKEQYDKARGRS